ncbi:MAG: hypothetical protein NVSMB27_03370 [Ktedonobacteraceae bacterium]
MLNTTQITVTKLAKRLSSSINRYFFASSQTEPEPVVDETELKKQLNDLLSTISQTFFDSLARQRAEEIGSDPEDNEQARQSTPNEFGAVLEAEFVKVLNPNSPDTLHASPSQNGVKESSSQQAVDMLMNQFRKNIQRHTSLPDFILTLETIFSQDEKKIKAFVQPIPIVGQRVVERLSPEMLYVIACIAFALQETAITTPTRYYRGVKPMPPSALETLEKVLKELECLRKLCNLPAPLRKGSEASQALYLQFAHADRVVWLPVRSLVTAPLASEEDLHFYARSKEDAAKLARQIVRGEGVFLITGYRGVGKSSFINQALQMLPPLEETQDDASPWHCIPVKLSVAKASSVAHVLHPCIRKLHETLTQQEANNNLLEDAERLHLHDAYMRTVFKVSLQQGDSIATSKHVETQASFGIKLDDILSRIGIPFQVGVGIGARGAKDWNNQLGRTISSLDYDEDGAEADIVSLIVMLARPRPSTLGGMRIKLVFVFDEMDKMELDTQKDMVKQLKNLFLERYAVFLLVTSKAFYYQWWKDRKKEDEVLASYFTWISMVPLFTSKETLFLLQQLIPLEARREPREERFVETFAHFLTYRARGVPRDILRELQVTQQWLQHILQPYITNQGGQYPAIVFYSEIQRVVEGMPDNILASPPGASPSSGSAAGSPTATDATSTPEHTWANEGRREQIKSGLYVLVEELLDQETMEINPDAEVFKQIRTDNFNMVSAQDFNSLLHRLAARLQTILIDINPESPLARYGLGSQLRLFELFTPTAEGGFQKLTVKSDFYRLTGRQISNTSSSETSASATRLEPPEIEGFLKQDDQVLRQLAISALQHEKQPFSTNINNQLFSIFISDQNGSKLRLDAVGLLQGVAAVEAMYHSDTQSLSRFIERETNEKLLQEYIRLIQIDPANTSNRREGTKLLLQLLGKYKHAQSFSVETQTQVAAPAMLSESLRIDAITALAALADKDIAKQVVETLDPHQDIPDPLLQPLHTLTTKFQRNLIELLVEANFTDVSVGIVQRTLRGQDYSQLMDLWAFLLERKRQVLAQRALVAIVQQVLVMSSPGPELNRVLEWLNSPTWDALDQDILSAAKAGSPDLVNVLLKVVDDDKKDRIVDPPPTHEMKSSTQPLSGPLSSATLPSRSLSSTPTTQYRINRRWLTTLVTLAVIALNVVLPFDLPQNVTFVYQLATRLLELGYIYGGIAALAALVFGIVLAIDEKNINELIGWLIGCFIALAIAGACFAAQHFWYPLVFTVWGQLALGVLAILIIGVPVGVWYATRTSVSA